MGQYDRSFEDCAIKECESMLVPIIGSPSEFPQVPEIGRHLEVDCQSDVRFIQALRADIEIIPSPRENFEESLAAALEMILHEYTTSIPCAANDCKFPVCKAYRVLNRWKAARARKATP